MIFENLRVGFFVGAIEFKLGLFLYIAVYILFVVYTGELFD